MDERFLNNRPIDEQPQPAVPDVRLAILFSLIVVPLLLVAIIVMKPAAAHATLAHVASLLQPTKASEILPMTDRSIHSVGGMAGQPPQNQAEALLQEALGGSSEALDRLSSRVEDWQGELTLTPRLTGLLDSAVNSNDLRVRSAALDLELAANNLPKSTEAANSLMARIQHDAAARPWALWMLGAMANRGVEEDHAFRMLLQYAHDPDEKTRYWAVAGLSLIGSDATIQPLLDSFRNDPSPRVRETAGCGLAQSGMLKREQRRTAVPTLIRYAGDSSLDPATRMWVYQALRDITGARVGNDPAAWRDWLSENPSF
jgi:HEAT repeat protein